MVAYCKQCNSVVLAGTIICGRCGNVFPKAVPIDNSQPGIYYWPPAAKRNGSSAKYKVKAVTAVIVAIGLITWIGVLAYDEWLAYYVSHRTMPVASAPRTTPAPRIVPSTSSPVPQTQQKPWSEVLAERNAEAASRPRQSSYSSPVPNEGLDADPQPSNQQYWQTRQQGNTATQEMPHASADQGQQDRENYLKEQNLEDEINSLNRQRQSVHEQLMAARDRAQHDDDVQNPAQTEADNNEVLTLDSQQDALDRQIQSLEAQKPSGW